MFMTAPRNSGSSRKPLIKNERFSLEAAMINKVEEKESMDGEEETVVFSGGGGAIEAKEGEDKTEGQHYQEQQQPQHDCTDQMEEQHYHEQQQLQHDNSDLNEAEQSIHRGTESDPRRDQLAETLQQGQRSSKFRVLAAPSDETESQYDLSLELSGE